MSDTKNEERFAVLNYGAGFPYSGFCMVAVHSVRRIGRWRSALLGEV